MITASRNVFGSSERAMASILCWRVLVSVTYLAVRPQQWLRATQTPSKPLVSSNLTCFELPSVPTSRTRVGRLAVASWGHDELWVLKQLFTHFSDKPKQACEFADGCAILPLIIFATASSESVKVRVTYNQLSLDFTNKPSSADILRMTLHWDRSSRNMMVALPLYSSTGPSYQFQRLQRIAPPCVDTPLGLLLSGTLDQMRPHSSQPLFADSAKAWEVGWCFAPPLSGGQFAA